MARHLMAPPAQCRRIIRKFSLQFGAYSIVLVCGTMPYEWYDRLAPTEVR